MANANNVQPIKQTKTANRVVCQGVIYSICKECYQVIGKSPDAADLGEMERNHRCVASRQV